MNKKIGKFKLWQLIVIGSVIGGALYLYSRNKEPGAGAEPEELIGGISSNGAGEGASSGGGVPGEPVGSALDNFLGQVQQLREAGFFGTPEREVIQEFGEQPGNAVADVAAAVKHTKAAKKSKNKGKKAHNKGEHKSTQQPKTTGGGAHAPATHHSQPHPAGRIDNAKNASRPNAPVAPRPVTGGGGGIAQVGGAGGASGGVIHPLAFSSGIGAGHPKPPAPPGYHTYAGANGQWWFAPNG